MAKGRLANAKDRACVICGKTFTPARRKQEACPPSTGRSCAMTLSNRKRAGTRDASGKFVDLKPEPRECEKCGHTFQPVRVDAKTCGAGCPGRPDYTLTCANPACAEEFTVAGNSQGKGNQQYCSESCREVVGRIRRGERFRKYGMTEKQYLAKTAEQDGCCKICGRRPKPDKRRMSEQELPYLVVDHDHETDQLRDLLCSDCNIGLGMFHDSPAALKAAATYLEYWHALLRASSASSVTGPGRTATLLPG